MVDKKKILDIPVLDGVRAVAFILVYLSHTHVVNFIPGGFGVTVFFFLSGYLITTLLRMEYQSDHRVNYRYFFLRRSLRIIPTYVITLLIIWLAAFLGVFGLDVKHSLQADGFFAQLFFLSNYWSINAEDHLVGIPPGSGVFWSLAVEEHFYLLYPFLFVFIKKSLPTVSKQAVFIASICVAILLWRLMLVYGIGIEHRVRTSYGTDTRIDSILFGCLMGLWLNPALDKPANIAVNRPYSLLLLSAALIFVTLLPRNIEFRETIRYSLQGVGLFIGFYVIIASEDNWVSQLLSIKLVRWIGTLSFSLYLIHYAVIHFLEYMSVAYVPVFALLISICYSVILRYTLEAPLNRVKARFSGVARQR